MDELKEWIICGIIGLGIYFGIEAWENKDKEDTTIESSYTPSQSSYTSSQPSYTNPSSNANIDWEPIIDETEPQTSSRTNTPEYTYSYSYSSSIGGSNNGTSNKYDNYEETSRCLDGEIVYEGDDDYYIVETRSGYTILERRSGEALYEGDRIRGELHNYGTTYIIKKNTDREIRVYIEDYMLSDNKALEWMGEHNHLKGRDQDTYDYEND